jgi:hypothetical protein
MTDEEWEAKLIEARKEAYLAGYEFGLRIGAADQLTAMLEKGLADAELPANSRFGGSLPASKRKASFH